LKQNELILLRVRHIENVLFEGVLESYFSNE